MFTPLLQQFFSENVKNLQTAQLEPIKIFNQVVDLYWFVVVICNQGWNSWPLTCKPWSIFFINQNLIDFRWEFKILLLFHIHQIVLFVGKSNLKNIWLRFFTWTLYFLPFLKIPLRFCLGKPTNCGLTFGPKKVTDI